MNRETLFAVALIVSCAVIFFAVGDSTTFRLLQPLSSCSYSKPSSEFSTNEISARYERWDDIKRPASTFPGCSSIMQHLANVTWLEAPLSNHSHRRWVQHAHDLALASLFTVNTTKVQKLFAKKPGETLVGHVFGGSFTAGMGCDRNPDCPFSTSLNVVLQQLMPDVTVAVRNHGKGGTNSKVGLVAVTGVLSAKNAETPDFVVLDFSVNDLRELYLADKSELTAIYEAHMETISFYAPDALVFLVVSEYNGELENTGNDLIAAIQSVALHRRAAFVNFRSGCQFLNYCPFRDGTYVKESGCKPYATTHPGNSVHRAVGETLVDAFVRLYLIACENVSPTRLETSFLHPKKKEHTACMRPLRHISAYDPPAGWVRTALTNTTTGWVLAEDRPGKPGWMSTTVDTSITFEVAISSQMTTMLAVTYLKSYTGLCPVIFSNSVNSRTFTIQPLWTRPFSVSYTQWYQASLQGFQDPDQGLFGLGIAPGSTFNVTLTVAKGGPKGCKFKLISIVSC